MGVVPGLVRERVSCRVSPVRFGDGLGPERYEWLVGADRTKSGTRLVEIALSAELQGLLCITVKLHIITQYSIAKRVLSCFSLLQNALKRSQSCNSEQACRRLLSLDFPKLRWIFPSWPIPRNKTVNVPRKKKKQYARILLNAAVSEAFPSTWGIKKGVLHKGGFAASSGTWRQKLRKNMHLAVHLARVLHVLWRFSSLRPEMSFFAKPIPNSKLKLRVWTPSALEMGVLQLQFARSEWNHLSGPISHVTATLSLRYPILRDTSKGGQHSPKMVRYPPLGI